MNNKIVSESAINSVSVCLLDTTVKLAKTDEPIELSFGLLTWLGPRAGRYIVRARYVVLLNYFGHLLILLASIVMQITRCDLLIFGLCVYVFVKHNRAFCKKWLTRSR